MSDAEQERMAIQVWFQGQLEDLSRQHLERSAEAEFCLRCMYGELHRRLQQLPPGRRRAAEGDPA